MDFKTNWNNQKTSASYHKALNDFMQFITGRLWESLKKWESGAVGKYKEFTHKRHFVLSIFCRIFRIEWRSRVTW